MQTTSRPSTSRFTNVKLSASGEYFRLDPRRAASTDRLIGILRRLRETEDAPKMVEANIALELSQHPAIPASGAERYLATAKDILNKSVGTSARNMLSSNHPGPLRAHLPVFEAGIWSLAARKQVGIQLFGLLRGYNEHYLKNPDPQIFGRSCELFTMLVLSHAGLEGVTAQPSYARQESSTTKVDRRNYNWDVTGFSDGSRLPEGEYRLQIKRQDHGHLSDYHPDIVRVPATRILHLSVGDEAKLFRLATAIRTTADPAALPAEVIDIQGTLLDQMQQTGAAAPLLPTYHLDRIAG